jgi:hypothetical protein
MFLGYHPAHPLIVPPRVYDQLMAAGAIPWVDRQARRADFERFFDEASLAEADATSFFNVGRPWPSTASD